MGQRTDVRYDTDDDDYDYGYDYDYEYNYDNDNNNGDGKCGDDDYIRRTTFLNYLSYMIFFAHHFFYFLNFLSLCPDINKIFVILFFQEPYVLNYILYSTA